MAVGHVVRIAGSVALALAVGCAGPSVDDTSPEEAGQSMFSESDAYERFMGRWSRQLAPGLVQFAGIADGQSVLDVGSGTGAVGSAILDATASTTVIGIDPSQAYVAHATAATGHGRATFEVGDAQQMRFDDNTFDRTVSLLVMNFIPEPGKALDEMVRVTRPGGVVSAAVWDYGDGMQMLRILWDEAVALDPAAEFRDERHMRLCRPGELTALWQEHGLQNVEEKPLATETVFTSFEDYWAPFLAGQGPAGAYVAALPPDRQEALAERLRARLTPGGDGPIRLQAKAWAVKGTVAGR